MSDKTCKYTKGDVADFWQCDCPVCLELVKNAEKDINLRAEEQEFEQIMTQGGHKYGRFC